MVVYKQLHSTLTVNNQKILVDLCLWAEKTLQPSQLDQFNIDREELSLFYQNFIDSGELIITPIIETVTTSRSEIGIIIGSKYTWADQRQSHTKHEYWQAQFAADTNVNYRPEILEG